MSQKNPYRVIHHIIINNNSVSFFVLSLSLSKASKEYLSNVSKCKS